jgi:hypothetical protein
MCRCNDGLTRSLARSPAGGYLEQDTLEGGGEEAGEEAGESVELMTELLAGAALGVRTDAAI